ncbi:MAG: hypothetical protein HOO86_07570 [Bacteroidales bacterium]|nr:hypothetical protein [Bacteroidales bacterium]
MVTQDNFLNLIEKIIESEFPEEKDIFNFEKKEIIENVFQDKQISTNVNFVNRGGVPSFEIILGYVSSIVGTFKTISEIYKMYKNDYNNQKVGSKEKKISELDELKLFWINDLVNAGMEKSKAKKIADRFIYDLIKVTQ